jgi:uncharacterized protein (DUF2267 family)
MTHLLSAFENTVQTTDAWLEQIMGRMEWTDKEQALRALRVVLHALRDRMTVDNAAHFGAQLPLLIRGIFYEGWHPAGKPVKQHKIEFVAMIKAAFQYDESAEPEKICRAVFNTIRQHLTPGAVNKVTNSLPGDLRSLWNDDEM